MEEPTWEHCYPYTERFDASCGDCAALIMSDYWERHFAWHQRLWAALQGTTPA